MRMLFGLVGGAIGGLIGAGIWTAVGYFTGYEVGWIAWGVGVLVGIGVAAGMQGNGGVGGAGNAVILSILAIALGKWAVVYFTIQQALNPDDMVISSIAEVLVAERQEQGRPVGPPRNADEPRSVADLYPASIWEMAEQQFASLSSAEQDRLRTMPFRANPDYLLSFTADRIVEEYEAEGRKVQWPPGRNFENAWRQADYPADVWADAVERLDQLSESERREYQDEVDAAMAEHARVSLEQFEREASGQGFLDSFSPFDLLWVLLAVATAAKIGYGGTSKEQ